MTAPEYRSARSLLAQLAAKRVAARELLDAAVARNEALKQTVNAVVRVDIERARREATRIDDARARGEVLGPLAGLPMTVKECLDLEGLPASAANKAWLDRESNTPDAEVVRRVRAAGAVVWGKTNVPVMAGDYQTFNELWGTTCNPYDVSRTPGGSSGGGCAAVASGISALEIGSDMGGSIRTPASLCGVVGMKPTWGALPLRGHVPPDFRFPREADLAVIGPIARDSTDVRLLWRVLSGTTAAPDPQPALHHPKGLRIAVISDQEGWPVAREIRETLEATAARLEADGAIVSRERPEIDFDRVLDTYLRLVTPIIGADVPMAIHVIGKLLTPVQRLIAKPRVDLDSRLLLLRYMTASHREWQLADSIRWQMIERMRSFFERFDVMFLPVLATWAFPHDQNRNMFARKLMVDDVAYPYYTTLCWIALATTLRLPAISVRTGTASDGLPLGIQIVGPAGSEERLLDVVAMIEERGGGFKPPAI